MSVSGKLPTGWQLYTSRYCKKLFAAKVQQGYRKSPLLVKVY